MRFRFAIVASLALTKLLKETEMYKLFTVVMLLVSAVFLSGCESEPPKILFDEIDMTFADAGSGEKLFQQSNNGAPTCISCHSIDGSRGVGPSLQGIGETAGNSVNGQSAEEYLYWSIISPSLSLTTGYSNLMYAKYGEAYEPADIADLIAYLLSVE